MKFEEIQKRIWDNKLKKGFNTTNVYQEFCLLYGEVAEAFDAYNHKKDDLGGELADIGIYLFALAEMLGYNLGEEIEKKMAINEKRHYDNVNGVWVRKED